MMKDLLRNSILWNKVRKHKILKKHQNVSEFWTPIIENYYKGTLPLFQIKKKKDITDEKIIWQYWGQGISSQNLPDIVRICFASVDKFKSGYKVIRITDQTISEYVEFPSEVLDKLKNGIFTRTAFSDLLRLALLCLYGGVWLDATILLTETIPDKYAYMDFFMFQRSSDIKNPKFWENIYAYYWGWYPGFKINMLSSVIFSHPNNKLITDLCNIMLYLWVKEEHYPDYFAFQILYDNLIKGPLQKYNCPIVSDTIPHLLQMKLNDHDIPYSYEEIMQMTSIHKMCYFDDDHIHNLKKFVRTYINIKGI